MTKIKRGDRVVVTAGKDKGREGKVLIVDAKKGRVVVEGANMVKKHSKANQQNPTGGIIERESPIDISNIAYLHKGRAVRLGFVVETAERGGKITKTKKRVARPSGDIID
ncbi:MAG: 50S ribosomal protein L24 [Defluviitaleaceae bacterium]|nr:50S ribosomal protein L24 [Defluviitaleaceae bacterium]